jgi:CheY-like chemotaxis protein
MTRKILLADDSLTIQKVVELTFMEGDYEVSAVSNGDDALAKLGEMSPDIVIADVHMPGADGFEICRATKERFSGIPVLLLVGTFEPFEESSAQELLRLVEDLLSAAGTAEEATGDAEEDFAVGPIEVVAPVDEPEAGLETSFGDIESAEAQATVMVEPPEVEDQEAGDLAMSEEVEVEETAGPAVTGLSDEDVDRIARRVVELMSDQTVREISWDVIPDLAEIVIKDRIRELENQVD